MGNGLSSYEQNDNSLVYFAYYHGLLGNRYGRGRLGNLQGGAGHEISGLLSRHTIPPGPTPVYDQVGGGWGC